MMYTKISSYYILLILLFNINIEVIMHNGCKEDEYVLYGDYVYIFKKHVLKTTYPLPSKEHVLKHLKN